MSTLRVLEAKLIFSAACLVFKLALDVSYVLLVNPVYLYQGFTLNLSFHIYAFGWIVYLLCLLLSPHLLNKVSDYFLASFLLTVIAPLTSLVSLSGKGFLPLAVTFFVFLLMRSLQTGRLISGIMLLPHVPNLKEGRFLALLIALSSVLVLIFWYYHSGAVRYFNLDLMEVYKFRKPSAELANIGGFAYFNVWVYKIFSIFLMSYCLWKRMFSAFILLALVQVYFYGVSNQKSVLFYPVMIFVLWLYFSRTKAMSIMPLGFTFIVSSCLALYVFWDSLTLGSMFIVRVFFLPAKLTLDYFSFFGANEFVLWSNSLLSSFLEYPYEMTLSKLIGHYNGSDSSANNGFIPSGYAHAGILGVIVYAVLFSYFLKILDTITINSDAPVWLVLCMTIVPLRDALISSDLLTTMLTHGLALSLIMVVLFRRSRSRYMKRLNGLS